jgi:hypothetical protein
VAVLALSNVLRLTISASSALRSVGQQIGIRQR